MSWTLKDDNTGNTREFDSKAEAEESKNDLISLGADPGDLEIVAPDGQTATDGGGPDVVNPEPAGNVAPEPSEDITEQLPDEKPSVDTDPLEWVPSDFIDRIDGSPAINRKGYEVLAHHYGIGTSSDCVVGPEETGFEFCRVKATAITEDGTEYQAHGSASVSRGDDSHLLLEMADTRARKRAIAQATGVGMVAVSELRNDL